MVTFALLHGAYHAGWHFHLLARALEVFLHDCPPDLAREAAARLRRQHWRISQETTPLREWPDTPTDAIVCQADRAANPEWSRRVAWERLGVVPLEIDGGHSPFLSRPAELATLLTTDE